VPALTYASAVRIEPVQRPAIEWIDRTHEVDSPFGGLR
jgi:hypothetical protein